MFVLWFFNAPFPLQYFDFQLTSDDAYYIRNVPVAFNNGSINKPTGNLVGDKLDVPQPHPLPMPEYGGYFAPLTEYLPDSSQPISGFHRYGFIFIFLFFFF